ncbi:MAG: hypothetical protein RIR00_840 [Pseudomonadota bacterium]|jgi:N utilization substance protein B
MSDDRKPAGNKAPAKSPRRRARELALQGLYQWRVAQSDEAAIEAFLPEIEGYAKADQRLMLELIRGVMRQSETLIERLLPHLDRGFNELSPIEACVLLQSAFELHQHPETPYRVVINEAIELAKTFGGTDGHKYVNGVLDKLAAVVRSLEVEARRREQNPR